MADFKGSRVSVLGKNVLIHNLSHSDLILGVKFSDKSGDISSEPIVARPKFSQFNALSVDLFKKIQEFSSRVKIYKTEGYIGRSSSTPEVAAVPVGYELPSDFSSWKADQLRFRDEDKAKISTLAGNGKSLTSTIHYIYFPLISVLLRKWLNSIGSDPSCIGYKKIVILVSGRDDPIDNKSNDLDNSTEFTAKLIKLFIEEVYPEIDVHLLHSTANLFRYDANIAFVRQDLLPKIEEIREDILSDDPKWRDRLKLTLSFADGSTARISAINASLKYFTYPSFPYLCFLLFLFCRPNYMHFWILKSFWREKKVTSPRQPEICPSLLFFLDLL
jgi:hypothetical protein